MESSATTFVYPFSTSITLYKSPDILTYSPVDALLSSSPPLIGVESPNVYGSVIEPFPETALMFPFIVNIGLTPKLYVASYDIKLLPSFSAEKKLLVI